jgi:hypothetical protein
VKVTFSLRFVAKPPRKLLPPLRLVKPVSQPAVQPPYSVRASNPE